MSLKRDDFFDADTYGASPLRLQVKKVGILWADRRWFSRLNYAALAVQRYTPVFLFTNSKCKRLFHNRLRPAMLTWTAVYRKQHRKDIHAEAVKKRRRTTKKPYSRSIVGASLEVIQKRRTEKAEVRDAAREAALREVKERIKKTKDEKKAKKAELMAKTQKTQIRASAPKAPKGPKLGGGGGKR